MIDFVLDFLGSGFEYVGALFVGLLNLLAKPLSYVLAFLDGIFYFIMQLFNIVIHVIKIFVAILQFFGSLIAGFFRSIYSLLTIDFYKSTPHYPSASGQGISVVVEVLRPTGVITVVPLIILAVIWAVFIKQIVGLIGGEIKTDA